MVKLFGLHSIDKKALFQIGKNGFIITLMVFGFLLITNTIDKHDDLKAYYNFWQHIWPRDYYGASK
jgi:hypothetical protein